MQAERSDASPYPPAGHDARDQRHQLSFQWGEGRPAVPRTRRKAAAFPGTDGERTAQRAMVELPACTVRHPRADARCPAQRARPSRVPEARPLGPWFPANRQTASRGIATRASRDAISASRLVSGPRGKARRPLAGQRRTTPVVPCLAVPDQNAWTQRVRCCWRLASWLKASQEISPALLGHCKQVARRGNASPWLYLASAICVLRTPWLTLQRLPRREGTITTSPLWRSARPRFASQCSPP